MLCTILYLKRPLSQQQIMCIYLLLIINPILFLISVACSQPETAVFQQSISIDDDDGAILHTGVVTACWWKIGIAGWKNGLLLLLTPFICCEDALSIGAMRSVVGSTFAEKVLADEVLLALEMEKEVVGRVGSCIFGITYHKNYFLFTQKQW